MHIVLAADIFGDTKAFQRLEADLLSYFKKKSHIRIHRLSPYLEMSTQFEHEQAAYQHFSQHIGIRTYSEQLRGYLKSLKGPVIVIGFSVGASALWSLLNDDIKANIKLFIGFYGGQIRHQQALMPKITCQLIFPYAEPHFDVKQLINVLTKKPRVYVQRSEFSHGFMNQCSEHFSAQAYQKYLDEIVQHVQLIC